MNIHTFFYKSTRAASVIAIFGILTIGFFLPISFIQALVINPVILVLLMIVFSLSNQKCGL